MRLTSQNCGLYTGLLFIPWWYAMWTIVWRHWWRLTPNLSPTASCQQRHLRQPPVLAGSPVSRGISVAATSTVWRSCQQRHLCGSHQYYLAVLPVELSLWQPPVLSGGPVSRHLWQPPVLARSPVSRGISVAATSTVWHSCHSRHLWSKWESGRRKWEFSLTIPAGRQEIFYIP
jgi:hypothetical protein